MDELRNAIKRVKNGNTADSNGIRAEDIKACSEETKEMVRQIFNEILKQNEFTLEAWRRSEIASDTPKRRRGKCWRLTPDMLIACVVQTVLDGSVRKIVSTT